MSKKANVTKSKVKPTSSVYDQEDKGLFAILVADLHNSRFEPLNEVIPPSLLPLSNVPILYITLSLLVVDGFKNIVIYANKGFDHVQSFVSHLRTNGCFTGVKVIVKNAKTLRCLGDVMRDVAGCDVLSGVSEFLLAPADLICGISLSGLLLKHKNLQERRPNAVLSLLLPEITSAISAVQASELRVSVVYSETNDNRLINYFRGSQNDAYPILLSSVMHSGQMIAVSTDRMNVQLCICSKHVPFLFQDNFDYETLDDLISDVLTNEEIMEYTIHVESLPSTSLILPAAPDLTSFMNINDQFLSRRFGVESWLPGLNVKHSNTSQVAAIGPQIFIATTATVHPKARLIGACYIGPGTKICDSAYLINCVLGSNCYVGKRSCLRRVVTLDNVYIEDDVKADSTWLCSQVRLLSCMILPHKTFVGPPKAAPVTLGPGPGKLQPKSVIVAPQQDDFVLDPVIGGGNVWASLYKQLVNCDELNSNENPSGETDITGHSGMNLSPNIQYRLWETAWDRIKLAAKSRRRLFSERPSVSRNLENRSSRSLRSRHLTDETALSDADSENRSKSNINFESGDEIEQLEEFLIGELKGTLERGEKHGHLVDTIVLEINSLKHAYNVAVDDLGFLLTKALLSLTLDKTTSKSSTTNTEDNKQIVTEFVMHIRALLSKLNQVFSTCTLGCQLPGRLYIQAVEDSACYESLIFDSCAYIFHSLYENDLVTEDDIWWWKDESPLLLDDDVADKTSGVRVKLKSFFDWLEQAEEEDDDDDE